MFVFDINDIALVVTRFVTRNDHVGLRTTSKHMSQCKFASSDVMQSKILIAGVEGPTELFDTTSGRLETLSSVGDGCHEPKSAVIRGRLYVCGGWNRGDKRATFSAESFHPLQKRWQLFRPMSFRRSGAASAVVGHHVYMCGSADYFGRLRNSVERFDTLSDIWEARRWGAGAAAIRERICVVGSKDDDGTKTSSAERFDGAWTTVPPMTHSRCLCSTPVIAEKLYVCGGDGNVPETVERFDPEHETWELLRPPLHQRVDAKVAVLRDRLYLVGARSDDNVALNSVERYDPDTDSWEESAPMLHARSGAKAVRISGSLHVFGGSAGRLETGEWSRSAEWFDPVTGWWEALLDMTVARASVVGAIHG